MNKNLLKEILPRPLHQFLRKAYYAPMDVADYLSGKRRGLVPPRRMKKTIGGGDITAVGREFLQLFVDVGKLKPTDRVLDVGCGVGRMALQLIHYLESGGSYDGFDIVQDEINWCSKKITPKYKNFRFQFSDVFNKVYNPAGKVKASEYRFPFSDETFDFIFLTSVFSHLLPKDMEHYLAEISRVLKKDGRTFITYFLLNPESKHLIDSRTASLDFRHEMDGYRTTDRDAPENAVAYDQQTVVDLYSRFGLSVENPIRYGSWCGRKEFLTYQDVIISTK